MLVCVLRRWKKAGVQQSRCIFEQQKATSCEAEAGEAGDWEQECVKCIEYLKVKDFAREEISQETYT